METEVKDTTDAIDDQKTLLKLPVRRMDGSDTGELLELDPRLFGLPKNDHVLYLAVKAELANRRQGTHSSRTRSMVRGGGAKPWRQKGRGAARAGTLRSPIWRGGGITFGPQPHDHKMKLPLKVKKFARKVALSLKAQTGAILLVEDFDIEQPKTRVIASMLNSFEAAGQSALILVDCYKPSVMKSCRNIPRLEIREALTASTYDILRARRLILSRSAVETLTGGLIGEE